MGLIVPAVLPSSYDDLKKKLAFIAEMPSVRRVQIDVVDGIFASPASWPDCTTSNELADMTQRGEMLPQLNQFEYEIDLMCLDALSAAADWLALGATRLTFHAESTKDPMKLLASARTRYGSGADFTPGLISFGLALNITSDSTLIESCINEISYVQFMGIEQIGGQGRPFDTRVLEKVREFHHKHPNMPIQVDGGVSVENARSLLAAGTSTLVVGSALLRADSPAAAIEVFEHLENPYGV